MTTFASTYTPSLPALILLLAVGCDIAPQSKHPDVPQTEDGKRYAANQEKLITDQLLEAGYTITYDYLSAPSAEPSPEIKEQIAIHGQNYVGNPYYIGNGGELSHLELLADLPSLHTVDFDKSNATDDDLHYLETLPNLRLVFLNETNVKGDGLSYLVAAPVETLHLGYSVGAEAIPHLKQMQNLKTLYVASPELRDHIDELRKWLPGCKVP